ncbi:MAG: response regulator [Candidatus Omnitrophica bacterium]|nr:response regulator [Candidatus Omnitrophota bacterium]
MDTKTILVIDDEPEYLDILKQFLQEAGYHVLTASDGDEGLKTLAKVRPDLVIMDVTMPNKDGLQFFREISTAHGRAKLPVLVLTARGELEPVFRELEAEGFLEKPVDVPKLLKEVEAILSRKKEKTVFLMDRMTAPHTREVVEALRKERYHPVVVEDLAAFRRELEGGEIPDFILLEYAGAGNGNPFFIQEIKETLSFKKISGRGVQRVPVIVYTYTGADFERKSLTEGADRYLGRPQHGDDLIVAIRQFEIEEKEKRS